jgi:hypothetical protein
MRHSLPRRLGVLGLGAVLAIGLVGIAGAQAVSNALIAACVNNGSGTIHVVPLVARAPTMRCNWYGTSKARKAIRARKGNPASPDHSA